jgi:predicted HNH restriction endonuclease|tara:strand:+ start:12176 stop:12514 length:339 start_codon:yes stop_codon:yes gene_type:complete
VIRFGFGENRKSHLRGSCQSCYGKIRSREKNKVRKSVDKIKKDLKCKECGFDNPHALQFHHLDPNTKKKAVAELISSGYNKEAVQKEIDKCIVLCANCHLIMHRAKRDEENK